MMEEDWDNETGFPPISTTSSSPSKPQRSRGRGFWNGSDSDQDNWRKPSEPRGRGGTFTGSRGFGRGRGFSGASDSRTNGFRDANTQENRETNNRHNDEVDNGWTSSKSWGRSDNEEQEETWGRNRSDDRPFDGRGRRGAGRGAGFGRRSDDAGQQGASEGADNECMTVPSDKVGRIIGRGGAKIRELQDDSGARINIKKDSETDGETSVELTGTADAVAKARKLIEELVNPMDGVTRSFGTNNRNNDQADNGSSKSWGRSDNEEQEQTWGQNRSDDRPFDGRGRRGAGQGAGFGRRGDGDAGRQGASEGADSECMTVPSDKVGRIIGRGGTKIRELQDDSGARINIKKDSDTYGETSVELTGTADAIANVRKLIEELVNPMDGVTQSFGTNNRNNDQVNNGSSKSWGRSDNEEQEETLGRNRSDDRPFDGRGGMGAGRGGGFGRRSDDDAGQQGASEGADSECMTVPSDKVGRIIGRGGTKIRELQDDSGARINIKKDSDTYGETSVELTGTADAIANVRKLIEELVNPMDGVTQSFGTNNRNNDQVNNGSSKSWGRSDNEEQEETLGRNRSDDRPFDGRGGMGAGRGGGFGRRSDDDAGQQGASEGADSECMTVPSDKVGRIIGRGGAKIRELQDDSGARINIKKDSDTYGETSVELTGTADAVAKVRKLIEELVMDGVTRSFGRSSLNDNASNRSSSSSTYEEPPKVKINWSQIRKEREAHEAKKWAEMPPIRKQFYVESQDVANMHPDEVEQFRQVNNSISVVNMSKSGDTAVPNPVRTFEEAFQHYPLILETISKQNFDRPSPVQAQAWPVLLQGSDLIGIAQTGTGKTLAFLLPAFIHIDGQPVAREDRVGPSVLVLSPTRELALQIEEEVKKFHYKGIKSVCIYGGGDRREQINVCNRGVEIVVATPGRLNDLINNGTINVKSVTYLVLDEADKMLDMGFEPEIRKVLIDIRPDRQTIMTSATWPEEVRRMGQSYLTDPIQVFVGSLDLAAVHSVTQLIEIVNEEDKKERVVEFIKYDMQPEDKVLIFVGRKVTADDLSSDFTLNDIVCQCIHGDREQYDREQALSDFKTSEVRILVATDVASRGLDVKDITHVFNYDMPRSIDDYVHRIGRTGRAGRTGTSITLLTRQDWRKARDLIGILVEANQEVPPGLEEMAQRYAAHKEKRDAEGGDRFGGGGRGFGGGGGRGFGGGGGRGFGGGGGRGFGGGGGGGRNRRNEGGIRLVAFDSIC